LYGGEIAVTAFILGGSDYKAARRGVFNNKGNQGWGQGLKSDVHCLKQGIL